MIRSLAYNNGLKQKRNPFKKEWGSAAASRDAEDTVVYRVTSDTVRPEPAEKPQPPSPVYTVTDTANTYAAVMVAIAVLWVVLSVWVLPGF